MENINDKLQNFIQETKSYHSYYKYATIFLFVVNVVFQVIALKKLIQFEPETNYYDAFYGDGYVTITSILIMGFFGFFGVMLFAYSNLLSLSEIIRNENETRKSYTS